MGLFEEITAMAKVLIVDDEPNYRRLLNATLAKAGHDVLAAESGRAGIDKGACFLPDVLVTDWMLRDRFHGLHVSQALRLLRPEMSTVMITGFACDELRSQAQRHGTFAFVEKPFDAAEIREAVREAAATKPANTVGDGLAVCEVDSEHRLQFATPAARALLAEVSIPADDPHALEQAFGDSIAGLLADAETRWRVTSPAGHVTIVWRVRASTPREHGLRFVALQKQCDPQFLDLPLIETLLDCEEPPIANWPSRARVLVVDPRPVDRQLALSMLGAARIGCFGVGSRDEALSLLRVDQGLSVAVLHRDACGEPPAGAVAQFRQANPRLLIVGCGFNPQVDEVPPLTMFLPNLWRVTDLVRTLGPHTEMDAPRKGNSKAAASASAEPSANA